MGGEKVIEGSKTGLPWGMLGEENADDKSMNWDDLDSTDFRERNSFQKEMADSDFVKPMVSSFSRMSPIQQVKVLPSIYYAADVFVRKEIYQKGDRPRGFG